MTTLQQETSATVHNEVARSAVLSIIAGLSHQRPSLNDVASFAQWLDHQSEADISKGWHQARSPRDNYSASADTRAQRKFALKIFNQYQAGLKEQMDLLLEKINELEY